MRAAGCDHGIENRRSMCGLIWLPMPSAKRPFDASCRSLAIDRQRHRRARERDGHAGRDLEPLGGLRREHQREERVVAHLGGGPAVVPVGLERARPVARSVEVTPEHPVDLHDRAPFAAAPDAIRFPVTPPQYPRDP